MQHPSWIEDAGGEEVPRAEADGFFWKPSTPSYLVGKLDRIDPGTQYGDFAVFVGAVVFTDDHKPQFHSNEQAIGLGASLAGKIEPHDAGKYFAVIFEGWAETSGGHRVRKFVVRRGLDAAKMDTALAKARRMLDVDHGVGDEAVPF